MIAVTRWRPGHRFLQVRGPTISLPWFPFISRSKRHVVCIGEVELDPIKLYGVLLQRRGHRMSHRLPSRNLHFGRASGTPPRTASDLGVHRACLCGVCVK